MPQKDAIANLSALIPKIVCYYIAIDSLTLLRGILKLVMNMPTHTKVHPRLRGEYCILGDAFTRSKGSPPLARGIPLLISIPISYSRFTPACAGNTKAHLCFPGVLQVHPRLRGEYNLAKSYIILLPGSPPLARGILILCL